MKGSVRNKLIALAALVILIPLILVGIVNYFVAKSELEKVGEMGLQNGTYAVLDLIDELNVQVENGALTLQEAQDRAKIKIMGAPLDEGGTRSLDNPAKYGENFYFYVVDEEGTLLVHPQKEGESLYESKTKDGRYFIREVIAEAKSGGGYVQYDWPLPTNLNVEAPTITRTVNRLAELGWLTIEEGLDRRERIVKLSEKAIADFPEIKGDIIRFETRFLERLTEDEQSQLINLLKKMELEG